MEVIADYFLVCAFGETHEAAVKNHDENLHQEHGSNRIVAILYSAQH